MTGRASKSEPFRIVLDDRSGVPVYRQIIDRVTAGIARGAIRGGDQLPTVRQLAVDLSINPNTVIRAYRELEIRGIIDTQQGTGTFISEGSPVPDKSERQRMLAQLAGECVASAGAAGFTLEELIQQLVSLDKPEKRKR
jgi:GntR family transcriptional regulator